MPRVLVAEDDGELRQLLAATLRSSGYETDEANNATEALALAQQCCPDVVLLDLLMPVSGGLVFLEEAARSPQKEPVPVIVVSGASTEARKAALRYPAVRAVLTKPFTVWDLLALVRQVVAPSLD